MTLTLGSLFDGIGGFPLAGLQHGITPLWASEIEPFPMRVTQYHIPEMAHVGDITKLSGKDLPHVDILTGGFPCQDISVAGRRAGLAGARSGLWWEFHRLIGGIRPAWVVIENVTGLMSSNLGRDLGTILKALDELGYVGAWRVLDAQFTGVPQRRRRIAIVGHLGDSWAAPAQVLLESESVCWPAPTYKGSREDTAGTLGGGSGNRGWAPDTDRMTFVPLAFAANQRGELRDLGATTTAIQAERATNQQTYISHHFQSEFMQCNGSNVNPIGTLRAGNGHLTGGVPFFATTADQVHYRKARRAQSDQDYETWEESDTTNTLNQFNIGDIRTTSAVVYVNGEPVPLLEVGARTGASTTDVRAGVDIGDPGDPMYTLQSTKQHGIINWLRDHIMVRRLTPLECERLQGFPDYWSFIPQKKLKPGARLSRKKDYAEIDGEIWEMAADGPRYRALGNAIAVPHFAWILGRIADYEARQSLDEAAD
jgi:DNA (cytosine-5)-methyltransferase 1